MKQNIKKQLKDAKGFTIIEVALVLAIAGLIFLVVFLALPALQRSQRDTARRQDAGRIVSGLQNCMADNQGSLDSCYAAVNGPVSTTGGYLGGKLSQITSVTVPPALSVPTTPGSNTEAVINKGGVCSGTTATASGNTSKNASVLVKIESGSFYCAGM